MLKIQTSVRMTELCHHLIAALSKKLGVSQGSVMELAIRAMAQRNGVK